MILKNFKKKLESILDLYYIFYKKNLTYNCVNPNYEVNLPLEIEYKVFDEDKNILDLSTIPYKLSGNEICVPYLRNLESNELFEINCVKGGRNNRYKIFLKDFNNYLLIRTKDIELKQNLDELLNKLNN